MGRKKIEVEGGGNHMFMLWVHLEIGSLAPPPTPPTFNTGIKCNFKVSSRTNRFIFLCWEVCKNHEPFLSFLLCLIGHHVPEGVVHLFGDPEVGGESDGDLGLLRLQEYKGAVNIRGP